MCGPERTTVAHIPSWHAWDGVILLLGVYINSFIDRTILTLLVGPIRETTGLSDSQVGFLIGPAFAIFWTIASVSFGLGRSFRALALARIGVGVGEASLSPAAYSIISDLFPLERLARALSVYSHGLHLGGRLAP